MTTGPTGPAGPRGPHELREHGVLVSDDRALLDLDAVHAYLTRSYWSPGVPIDVVRRAVEHSLCLGAYAVGDATTPPPRPSQVGCARVVTDRATYAYLCDVYVLETHRSRGVGKLLMRAVTTHPDLQNLRRFMLMTRDAHGLYAGFGFTPLADPSRGMEKVDPTSTPASPRRPTPRTPTANPAHEPRP